MLTGDSLGKLLKKIQAKTEEVKNAVIKKNEEEKNDQEEPLLDKKDEEEKEPEAVSAADAQAAEVAGLINDVDTLLQSILPAKIANIISFIFELIKIVLTDLLLIVFFMTQELMDDSELQMIILKPVYDHRSLYWAVVFSKIVVYAVLILVTFYVSAFMFNVYEGHCAGLIAI